MSSYAYTIAQSIKTAVEAIASPPTVVIRKESFLIKGDTLPTLVISMPEESGAKFATFGDGGSTFYGSVGKEYAYEMVLYREFGGGVQTNTDTLAAIRLAINQTLNKGSLSGSSTVWNVSISGGEAFENGGFGTNNERSIFGITVSSSENING